MNTALRASKAIGSERAIALIYDLVAISSVSRDERAAVEYFTRAMHQFGMQASIDEAGNAIGICGDMSPSAQEIVLLGHIDTVPGNIPVRIDNCILHGRGSVDAKGPLAVFACAAAQAIIPPGIRLVVIGAVEEEAATSKGARFAATQYRPAACFIGEPSGVYGVTLGYKGRLLVQVTARCEGSHSAGPAATAAELVTDWWFAARAYAQAQSAGHERVFDQVQSRLRAMNSRMDGDIEFAEADIGFRIPPGVDPEKFAIALQALPESGRVSVKFRGHEHAHKSERSDAVVRALTHAVRSRGMVPAPKFKTGTSDMNVVSPIWKCPIAAYGPGDSSLDHTPREHLILAEYLQSIEVLTAAIETLANELAGLQSGT